MADIELLTGIVFIFSLIIPFLAVYIFSKLKTIYRLKNTVTYLNQTIESLDYQSKLIIKSDMELKIFQLEVEDKLNKLSLLKNIIISLINTLDKEELFGRINEKLVNDLGFKCGIILAFDNLEPKVNIGFKENQIELIKNILFRKKEVFKSVFLLPKGSELYGELSTFLDGKGLLAAPLKARESIYGIFLVCDYNLSWEIKTADQELFAIVCMYLGQCLDNIKMFEQLYQSKEEAERRVRERTNELLKSLHEIERINKAKSDFISSVSHELRTPLTSIKGFSMLLAEEKFGKLPPEAKERLEKIDENVNKLVEMVNTLLDIAHIESGKIELKIAPFDLVRVIADVYDLMLPQLQGKSLNFKIDTPQQLYVYMDKNLIERVFINLINNAIKFTPPQGTIKVFTKDEPERIIVGVSDTGCGVPQENLEKVFEEFFRVDNPINRQIRGSGLGLSLVKRIVQLHKEKIWLETKVNGGTTFYFTLKKSEKPKP